MIRRQHQPQPDTARRLIRPAGSTSHTGSALATSRTSAICAGVLVALALALLAPHPARAQKAPPENIARKIKVMEGIIDQVLLDSPNFLVLGKDNTHGVYLSEFGAVFAFEASLVSRPNGLSNFRLPFRIQSGDHTILEIPGADEPDSDSLSTPEPPKPPKAPKIKGKSSEVRSRRGKAAEDVDPATLYANGKAELVQALLDYGDTMTSLKDDQWVAFAAFLKDSNYFLDNRISRLVLKARVRDLREYTAGRISETEMRSRIDQEEY